jgi:histone H3/H4
MAKIQEEIIVIKFSQLVKEGAESRPRVTEEVTAALTQVAEELVGTGVIVEIERA